MKLIPIDLNLTYTKRKMQDENGEPITPVMMSRFIISFAIEDQNPKMDRELSIIYRNLIMEIEEMVENDKSYLIVSKAEFDRIRREVTVAKFLPQLALMSPVLYEELDRCAMRSDTENQDIIERITHKTSDE